VQYGTDVESAVVHYGDITLTFLNNLYRADQRGAALTYVSAVAVEEKSVIDYNRGDPDGILSAGEEPRPPRVELVAIYPEEGTLFSDNPYFILEADWVDEAEAEAADVFFDFVNEPENQERVLEFGFRPGNPDVPVGSPIEAQYGVDPNQPQTLLEVPEPQVMLDLLDQWERQRKKAKVLLVLDISGSMGDLADAEDVGAGTKLDLAIQAAVRSLDLFHVDDEVALRVFSTDLGPEQADNYIDLSDYERVGDSAERLRTQLAGLFPTNGTPLYDVTLDSYGAALDAFAPDRINAVVLLSDGVNDDGDPSDDEEQLDQLLAELQSSSEGQASRPVRVFPIAYGADADFDVLKAIAEASASAVYNASDPTSIDQVLAAVISNF
jgi:Ca-activated chloride channel family protein